MNDSIKLASFFYERVNNTILHKELINIIEIGYEFTQSFGNEYIKVSYIVRTEDIKAVEHELRKTFNKTAFFVFPISTYSNSASKDFKIKLSRIIEFKNIYESILSYIVLLFENNLHPSTQIIIQGIDLSPEINYSIKYLNLLLETMDNEFKYNNYNYEILQWNQLHKLANESKTVFNSLTDSYKITDDKICELFFIDKIELRRIIINNLIPIYFYDYKCIETIYIEINKFLNAIKMELSTNNSLNGSIKMKYKEIIKFLYDFYLRSDKKRIINTQKRDYLRNLVVQKDDLLQLKDKRIVQVKSINFDNHNLLQVKYYILKTNLQPSQRTGTVTIDKISFVLKNIDFLNYKNTSPIKHLSLLIKWMEKRKLKINYTEFKQNLFNGDTLLFKR